MKRTELREIALKIIFQEKFKNSLEESLDYYIDENGLKLNESDGSYLNQLISSFSNNKEEIDSYISKSLNDDWTVDRLSYVDLSLIRLVIVEILYLKVPYKVTLDECIELSKKYSDDKSPGFLNAVISEFLKMEDIK